MKKILKMIMIAILFLISMTIKAEANENNNFSFVRASSPTIYKDWSAINMMNEDYSYSTMFYSEDTTIEVLKNSGDITWKTSEGGKRFPKINLYSGQEMILLVKNCAVGKNGKSLDIVIKVNQVNTWRNSAEDNIIVEFGHLEFLNSQTKPVNEGSDYHRPMLEIGELIKMNLGATFADCVFTMKYYVSGTYHYNSSTGQETGMLGEITSVNNFVYDLDVPSTDDRYNNRIFGGNEGLRPLTGNSTIYYNKSGRSIDPYISELQEINGGIAIKRRNFNTNGIWYKNSAFITATNLTNSTYSFQYGGCGCGIGFSFTSAYPYQIEGIKKSVSKTKVKEQENFNYTISQYIPNNYYGSLIKFNEVYSNLYGNTHYSKIEISDTLDDNLERTGNITITNEKGENKTDYFDISISGNEIKATAKTSVLGQVDFYAHTYNINIPVIIKEGTGPKLTNTSSISNQARLLATLENDNTNLTSNTVSTSLYYDVTTSITNGTITESASVDIHSNKTIQFKPNTGYYVKSVTIDGVEQDVSNWGNGGTISLTNVTKDYNIVIKTEAYGYIQITKKDSITKKVLAGAQINIYRDMACEDLVQTLTTGSSGIVKSNMLYPNVTYYVKEVKAPQNYVKDEIVHKAVVTPGNTTKIEILNEPYGQIQITKKNSVTQGTVAGAVIGIYRDSSCTQVVEGLERLTTTGETGTVTSNKIPAGTYYAKELQAPVNYTLNTEVQTITVKPSETAQVTFVNEPYGYIKVIKKDSVTGNGLANVKINIYRDSNCNDLIQTLITSTDGTAKSNLMYPNTTYYVKEIEAPVNYVIDKTVHQARVLPAGEAEVEILNEPYGQIQITKKNSVTQETVAGAVVGIYRDSSCTQVVEGLERLITAGTTGTVISNKIPAGTYYAKELQAPTNYTLNTAVQTVIVRPAQTTQITFVNEPYGYIQVIKKDKHTKEVLQGAKIGIYTDSACRNLVEALTTKADGTAKSKLIYPNTTYYIKEIEAPANYVLTTSVKTGNVNPGQTTEVVLENKPNTAQVEISKIDNNTGKIVTKEDTTFTLYEWSTNTNTWEKPSHIHTETIVGTAKDGKGAILTQKTTGTKGTYATTIYYNATNQGKFKVVEYARPYGYTTSNWEKEIQITREGQVFAYHSEVRNTQVRGQINLNKNDAEVNYNNTNYSQDFAQGDASLRGAVYGVYAKEDILSPDDGSILYGRGQQVTTGTTDENGKITWNNLYLGKYYIEEITPSKGYLTDTTKYEVDIQTDYYNNYFLKGDQTTSNIVYKNMIEDLQDSNSERRVISKEKIKKQSFQLTKLSLSEGSTMANPLQGAGFKIYLIKDLSKVKEGTIRPDANGNYKVTELAKIDLTKEQTALSFTTKADGERIPELFSNENGILVSPELAYGKYLIVESTVPQDVQVIEPFIVDIQEDNRTPKNMVYPIDREFQARIKIVKKDDKTKRPVLKENAAYRIWDIKNNKYVEQWITYPKKELCGTEKNPYKTTEEGYLITPNVLEKGEYELREVKAPDGYVIAGREDEPRDNVQFVISANSIYEVDPDLGAEGTIITVEQQNTEQMGTIVVSKQGEFLSQAQEREGSYQIEYTKRPVTDAEFAIYAKEDIYTQDNQGEKLYEKDQLIEEIAVNQEGKARFENLPLGKYYIKETKAGNGFVLNTEIKDIDLKYQGQEESIVYQEAEYTNERQKIEMVIIKKDREKGTTLQGAEFGLYTKEAIRYQDNSGNSGVIPANQLIGKASSGEDGRVIFNQDSLPLGKYYIKELVAPKGYAINPERVEFDCSYMGQNVTKIEKNAEFTNQKTKLEIKVIDHETEVDLVGTQIALKSEDGTLIGNYTIDNRGKIEVEGLEVGKEYKIEEIQPRKDYVKEWLFKENTGDKNELPKGKEQNNIVTFRIKDSEFIQKVTLRNMAKVGKLTIEKTGEVLTSTEQDSNGNIIFRYDTQKIDTATFEVRVKESIVHPDGKQGVIAQVGTIIGEGQTQNGILTITKFSEELIQEQPEVIQLLLQRGLPLGEYEIIETKAPNGYYYQKQKNTVMIETRDDTSSIEEYKTTIQNQRQVTNIGRPNPGIKLEKKAEKKVYQVGEEVVYHINVMNTGNTLLKNIEVQEGMLKGEFDQTEGILKQENNRVIINKLEVEEQKTLIYRYRLTEQEKGKVDNQVTTIATPVKIVLTPEGEKEETLEPIMEEAQEEIWSDTLIDKTVNKKIVKAGDLIEYTLIITNPFEEEIKDVIVEDDKIGVQSVISSSKKGITVENGKIILGNLQAKEKVQIVYQYLVPKDYKENELINTARLKGTRNKIPITSEEVTTTVEVKKSGIEITKQSDKEEYSKGEIVNYSIKVTNTGETELREITVKENLIKGKFDEKLGITVIDDQTVKIEKLDRGQSINLSYRYKVEEEKIVGEKIKNKVIATGIGIIEKIENPEQPILEEVSDEAEKEVIVTNQEAIYEQRLGVYKTDLETGNTIKGAIFGLYAAENIVDNYGKVLIAKDSLIEKVMTDEYGYAKFTADLPIAKYYVKEIKPAKGYKENTEKMEIDATSIISSEKEYPVRLEVQNEKTQINIEKIEAKERIEDMTQRKQILGAKLQILEEDKVIEEWTTEEEPHNIKGLETEKEYTIHEAKPAEGYVTASDFKFRIRLDGSLEIEEENTIEQVEIPTVVMQDEVTKVKVLVVDKETKEPIKGVEIQIVDKETSQVVYEFTTDEEVTILEKIPIGNYEIIEKEYPRDKGYVSIGTEEFIIEDTSEVQEKVIEQDYTKLDISFIDEVTKDLLLGGKLEIRNQEDEVVATIDKTDEHAYIERLPVGKYTIIEVEKPEGYEPNKKVDFMLKDISEIQYVVIENKRLPFDLKVDKYVSKVLLNGKTQGGINQEEKLAKIEVDGKKIANQNVEITYTIRVTNIGEVAGCVGKVTDKIPFGLTFDFAKNEKYWTANGNTITTTAFANNQIEPKESFELIIVLDWMKSEFNLGEKQNIVTIEEFSNYPKFEDNNKKNNQSEASVLLAVKTGMEVVLTKQIAAVIFLEIAIIGIVVAVEIAFLSKKY